MCLKLITRLIKKLLFCSFMWEQQPPSKRYLKGMDTKLSENKEK